MKTATIFLISSILLLFSCSENSIPETPKPGEGELREVIISVSRFTQEIENLSRAPIDPLEGINHLSSTSYNLETGKAISWGQGRILDDRYGNDKPSFGYYRNYLPIGKYRFCVLGNSIPGLMTYSDDSGGQSMYESHFYTVAWDFYIENEEELANFVNDLANLGNYEEYERILPFREDMFLGVVDFEVKEIDDPYYIEVELKRIVGQLNIELQDELPVPSWVKSIDVYYDHILRDYYPYREKQPTDQKRYIAWDNGPNLDLKIQPMYIYADHNNGDGILKIVAKDHNGKAVITKEIPNIEIQKNKKTIVRGKLFDTKSGGITADTEWQQEKTIIEF